jgi:hypothetical protein
MLFIASWAFLMGPYQYATHLMSGPRLPFTAAYFGSIVMTIYFAVGVSRDIALFVVQNAMLTVADLASLHSPDIDFVHCATRLVGLVSSQLFPHGKPGFALCCQGGRRPGNRVDERLICFTGCAHQGSHHRLRGGNHRPSCN